MAVVDDWAAKAARYIVDAAIRVTTWADRKPAEEIAAIIKEHCPFKDGVAYMPVPRCETCAYWEPRSKLTHTWSVCALSRDVQGSGNMLAVLRMDANDCPVQTRNDFGCIQWKKVG